MEGPNQNSATSEKCNSTPISKPMSANLNWKTIIAIIGLYLCYECSVLGYSLPTYVISYILLELGPSSISNWISIGWLVPVAFLAPVAGRITDIYGRRWVITG
jgi:MFS family permease